MKRKRILSFIKILGKSVSISLSLLYSDIGGIVFYHMLKQNYTKTNKQIQCFNFGVS